MIFGDNWREGGREGGREGEREGEREGGKGRGMLDVIITLDKKEACPQQTHTKYEWTYIHCNIYLSIEHYSMLIATKASYIPHEDGYVKSLHP